jgi:CrcB protein
VTVLLLLIGGAIGAPTRYLADRAIHSTRGTAFPWGTLTVNVVGSFLLGGLAAAAHSGGAPTWLLTLVGSGFCGALTTFSGFGLETFRLIEDGSLLEALANVAASLLLGLAAVAGGWALVSALL